MKKNAKRTEPPHTGLNREVSACYLQSNCFIETAIKTGHRGLRWRTTDQIIRQRQERLIPLAIQCCFRRRGGNEAFAAKVGSGLCIWCRYRNSNVSKRERILTQLFFFPAHPPFMLRRPPPRLGLKESSSHAAIVRNHLGTSEPRKNLSIDYLRLSFKIRIVPNTQNQLRGCFSQLKLTSYASCYLAPHLHFLQSFHLTPPLCALYP